MAEPQKAFARLRVPLLSPDAHSTSTLLSALSGSTKLVCVNSVSDKRRYSSYLRSLVAILAPYIGKLLGTEDGRKLLAGFIDAFTTGQELPAFRELVKGLDHDVFHAQVIVRALEVFISRQRLEAILEQAEEGLEDDVVGMVVHLGSKVANAIYGTDEVDEWDELRYLRMLADALLDSGGGLIAGRVTEGLAMSGAGDVLVRSWGKRDDGFVKASKVIKQVGERSCGPLVRAMAEEWQERLLGEFFKLRGIEHATRVALLNRPLLSRGAIATIVSAVSKWSPGDMPRAMRASFGYWASESFARGTDIKLQRQVTRAVLQWLRFTTKDQLIGVKDVSSHGSLSVELATGVHYRLGHGDSRIRRLGMLVAEAASRSAGDENPLKFDRKSVHSSAKREMYDEDTSDCESDLSDLAAGRIVEKDQRRTSGSSLLKELSEAAQEPAQNSESTNPSGEEPLEAWNGDDESDSWTSLEAYSISSEEEESTGLQGEAGLFRRDLKRIRESVSSPFSVVQILSMLRTVAGGGDAALAFKPETVAAVMRTVAAGAERASPTLRAYAPQLARAIIGIESEKFPTECIPEVSDARKRSLVKLLCVDIKNVGGLLIEDIICGGFAVLRKRSEAMTALTEAARILSHKSDNALNSKSEGLEAKVSDPVGTTTRRLEKSLQMSKTGAREVRNEFSGAADDLFYALANGIDAGGGADFLDLENRDTSIVAQALVTLAVFVSCAGPKCVTQSQMCQSLIDLSMVWCKNIDPAIRRAVAIALGSAAEAISPYELDDDHILRRHGGRGDAIEWLESASKGADPDAYVRRFAGKALAAWAVKMKQFNE